MNSVHIVNADAELLFHVDKIKNDLNSHVLVVGVQFKGNIYLVVLTFVPKLIIHDFPYNIVHS